jgi:hypothetical protein
MTNTILRRRIITSSSVSVNAITSAAVLLLVTFSSSYDRKVFTNVTYSTTATLPTTYMAVSAFVASPSPPPPSLLSYDSLQQQQQQRRRQQRRRQRTGIVLSSWLNINNNNNKDGDDDDDDDDDVTTEIAEVVVEAAEVVSATTNIIEIQNRILRQRFQENDTYVWLYKDQKNNPTSWEKYTITEITNNNDSDNDNDDHVIVTIEMSTKFDRNELYVTHHRIIANLTEYCIQIMNNGNSRSTPTSSNSLWKIGFDYYNYSNNEWISFGDGQNIQAFEEKFDIVTMLQMMSMSSDDSSASLPSSSSSSQIKNDNSEITRRLLPASTDIDVVLVDYDNDNNNNNKDLQEDDDDDNQSNSSSSSSNSSSSKKMVPVDKLMRSKRCQYTEAWYYCDDDCDDALLLLSLSGIAVYKEFTNSNHTFSLIEMTRKEQQ